jgi:hypothetical protein
MADERQGLIPVDFTMTMGERKIIKVNVYDNIRMEKDVTEFITADVVNTSVAPLTAKVIKQLYWEKTPLDLTGISRATLFVVDDITTPTKKFIVESNFSHVNTDLKKGIFYINIPPATTESLPYLEDGWDYVIKIYLNDSEPKTVLEGKLYIKMTIK